MPRLTFAVLPLIHSIVESFGAVVGELPSAWRRPAFRRHALLTAAALVAFLAVCCVPLGDGRPLIDVSGGSARAASSVLDAMGRVHVLEEDAGVLIQPGVASPVDSSLGLALAATLAAIGCLLWQVDQPRTQWIHTGMTAAAIVLATVANLIAVVVALLIAGATGEPMTSGVGGLLTTGLRVLLASGFLVALCSAVDEIARRRDFWKAISDPDVAAEEVPLVISGKHRPLQTGSAIVIVGLVAAWLVGRAVTEETHITTYRAVAENSLTIDDVITARVAVARLFQLSPEAAPHLYLEAQLLERDGKMEEAEALVRRIVESGGRPFEPAHRWLTDRIAKQRSQRPETRSSETVSHIKKAAELDPSNIQAHLALANTYLLRRSPEQAVRELEQVVDQRPDLRLTLARLCVLAGKHNAARLHGELARTFYQDELKSFPLALEPRMRLAASHLFLEEFEKAVVVLTKGWELTQNEAYRQALGVTYLVWCDTAARHGAGKDEQLSLLEKALKYDLDSEASLRRVAVLATREETDGPAIDLLTRSLAEQPIPASVHLILGTNAYEKGRVANALRHLEEAHRLDPSSVQVLNNLAWVLSETDDSSLERALELIDQAVDLDPTLAAVRETRGQILAKMERWSEAIAELENAMQVLRDRPTIHATLARAYEALGDDAMAAEYRRSASSAPSGEDSLLVEPEG